MGARWLVVLSFMAVVLPERGFADCTGPAVPEGAMTWVGTTMQYCYGTAWRALNNTLATSVACTPKTITYRNNEIHYCNNAGNGWVQTAPLTNWGACGAAVLPAGRFYYDTSGKYYWYCSGTSQLRRMGP